MWGTKGITTIFHLPIIDIWTKEKSKNRTVCGWCSVENKLCPPAQWCGAAVLSPWLLTLTTNRWGWGCFSSTRAPCRFEFHGASCRSACLCVELVSKYWREEGLYTVPPLRLGLYYPQWFQTKITNSGTKVWLLRQKKKMLFNPQHAFFSVFDCGVFLSSLVLFNLTLRLSAFGHVQLPSTQSKEFPSVSAAELLTFW